jgi:phospholipid/cholesterol/gamma-HCH transport system substrate-binding protein
VSRVIKPLAGLAVVLAIAATYLLVHNHTANGYMVRVMMADAGGLQSGSNVNVNGVTVGRVKSLAVTRDDRAEAMVSLNRAAAPIGAGARASVEIDGFFGERIMALSRGDYTHHPEPSGSTIPVSHSAVSVRLDDVLDALNPDAQGALRAFLDEDGEAVVGRGQDLGKLLAQLPQTLPALTTLLSDFSSNQRALGDLVDTSNRVVAQVAGQRTALTSMVNRADGALGALASRRDQLGTTVARAPATLAQATRTLARLQGTAVPLAPAADGLRSTAPSLLTALQEVPSFTTTAIPTLAEVSDVAPALDRLAAYGTPIVSQVTPLAKELTSYSTTGLSPLLNMLANQGGAASFFGEMEGWARSTQGYDAAGHVFRFGAAVSEASFDQLLASLSVPGLPPLTGQSTAAKSAAASSSSHPSATAVAGALGGAAGQVANGVSGTLHQLGVTVAGTVKQVTAGVGGAVAKVSGGVSGAVGTLHGGAGTTTTPSQTTTTGGLKSLLGYLMGS